MLTIWFIILIIITFALIIAGLMGLVFPFIPDLPLIWLGIAIYAAATKFVFITWQLLLILFLVGAAVYALDIWLGALGAKAAGASRYGFLGAMLGMLLGIFAGGPIGMMFGAFVGAFLGELILAGRNYEKALKAGLGTVIGFLAGRLLKIITAVVMVGIFLVKMI
ncbi:MAG: DUF456 domain-containing protein [bacterium]